MLGKALEAGLAPVVVVNKVDRRDARPWEVQNEVFDLFASLGASDKQLEFPTLFGAAKYGWVSETPETPDDGERSMAPLLKTIQEVVKPPPGDVAKPFRMVASALERDSFMGRILTGQVFDGKVAVGDELEAVDEQTGAVVDKGRVVRVLKFDGNKKVPSEAPAETGELTVIAANMNTATVGHTLRVAGENAEPLPARRIDPSAVSMTFFVNDSPLAGKGAVAASALRARLEKEAEGNVAINITESEAGDGFVVSGRGELQLAVLIEEMRREGMELSISRPRVLTREEDGAEPMESVIVDVDTEFSGSVVEKLGMRRGEMTDMRPLTDTRQRMTFLVPSRGLIGYNSEFLSDTRGTGILHSSFHSWKVMSGGDATLKREKGQLLSLNDGVAPAYALAKIQPRGQLFLRPNEKVYRGQIIGVSARPADVVVNPTKGKQLTNMRASGSDDNITLQPPLELTLEKALSFIGDDDLVEVTPDAIRLRKRRLTDVK